MSCADAARPWTVLLRQPGDAVPWHVRATDYLAVCPAIAWDEPVRLARGTTHELALDAILLDRALDPDEIETTLA